MADKAKDQPERMFTFSTGLSGSSVRCHNCGWMLTGRYPKDCYPKADTHVCPQERN